MSSLFGDEVPANFSIGESTMEADVRDILSALDLSHACIRDIDGKISYWSAGNERLYGWSRDEALGGTTHSLLQTEFPEPLEEINRTLLRNGSWSGELLHRDKSGGKVWVASHWVLKRTGDGTPKTVIEVNNDITGSRSATERARYSASIIASSDDAIMSKDRHGILTSWNPGAERLFGYSAEEVLGRSILVLFPPELVDEELEILARLKRGERIEHHETVRVTKSGERLDVSISVSPLQGSNGEFTGAAKIVRDISQRKRLERAIQESEERQRLALEGGQVGVWSFDISSEESYWSPRCKALFGLSEEDAPLGVEGSLRMIHPQDVAQVADLFRRCVQEGKSFDVDFRVIHPDGYVHWLQSRGRAQKDAQGHIKQAHGIITDISKRKQMEESLRRTNKQLEQFAYAAAHELQEPLRNVSLAIELAKRKAAEGLDQEAETLLNGATENARRMEEMMRNLLAYSASVQSTEGNWPVVDGNEVLQTVLQMLSASLKAANAVVVCDPIPKVRMDKTHLMQVLQNLINNALKYAKGDGVQIRVGATLTRPYCTVWVQDNGIGIKPEFRDRVFGLFKRLGDKQVEGTGIGLALCKRIVQHYGGEIWVDSDGVSGSRLSFTVPSGDGR